MRSAPSFDKALETLEYLTDLVGDKDTTISKLRKILFGASTEKIRNILGKRGCKAASRRQMRTDGLPGNAPGDPAAESSEEKPKGHGRNGAEDFHGSQAGL